MIDDAELLRRYAGEKSEEAFAEFVRRHIDLVFAVAARMAGGNRGLAEDVAQTVFADVARKAGALARHEAPVGWLHTAARFATAKALRAESRRRIREREAWAMNEAEADSANAGADWERLAPVLDAVLGELKERERVAILLRFFEKRPLAEVGERLALSETAARSCVDRALDRLQGILVRQGIPSTGAALALVLADQAEAAAPAGLAASVTGGALAGGALAGGAVVTIGTFLTMTKLQIGIAAAVVAAGAGGLVWQHRVTARLEAELVRVQASDGELRQLRAENQRLRAGLAERATRREERATVAGASGAGVAASGAGARRPDDAATGSPPGPPLAPGLVPVATLGNEGRATPRAAFATQLWAARTGEVDLEATALTFGPEARARLEALLATLPEALRAQYPTPEKLMAFILAGSPHPVGGMQVLGETVEGDHDVVLHTQWQHADDTVVHASDVHLQLGADGWRWVVPLVLVNRGAAYIGRMPAAAPGGR